MPNQELMRFIQTSRTAGQTDDQIKAILKQKGWQDALLEDAFKPQAPQMPQAPQIPRMPQMPQAPQIPQMPQTMPQMPRPIQNYPVTPPRTSPPVVVSTPPVIPPTIVAEKKSSSGKTILISLVVLLLVAGAAFAGYYFLVLNVSEPAATVPQAVLPPVATSTVEQLPVVGSATSTQATSSPMTASSTPVGTSVVSPATKTAVINALLLEVPKTAPILTREQLNSSATRWSQSTSTVVRTAITGATTTSIFETRSTLGKWHFFSKETFN